MDSPQPSSPAPPQRQFEIWELFGERPSDYWMLVHSELDAEDWETFRAAVVHVSDGVPRVDRLFDTWAMAMWRCFDGTLMVADMDGIVHSRTDGRWSTAPLGCPAPSELWQSPDGAIFCSAGKGRFLRLVGSRWELMNQGLLPASIGPDSARPEDLFSIGGSGVNDLYVRGDRGVNHFDGMSWSKLSAPLDHGLTKIFSTGPPEVHFSGRNGTFLTLRNGDWLDRSLDDKSVHLKGIANFRGEIFVGSQCQRLFKVLPDRLTQVAADVGGSLRAVGDLLFAFSLDRVQSFDGKQWRGTRFDFSRVISFDATE